MRLPNLLNLFKMNPASPKIKVCGLTQTNQAQSLTDSGVDFIGFIFYEKSPRFVLNSLSLKEIAEIPHLKKVGVFVNEKLDKIVEIANDAHLNLIQLHGDEDRQFIIDLKNAQRNSDFNWLEGVAIKEALRRLSSREKHILTLRFFEGKTQMEVADEIGISQAQVSRLEKYAINQIKKNITA